MISFVVLFLLRLKEMLLLLVLQLLWLLEGSLCALTFMDAKDDTTKVIKINCTSALRECVIRGRPEVMLPSAFNPSVSCSSSKRIDC